MGLSTDLKDCQHVELAVQALTNFTQTSDPRSDKPEARFALNYLDAFGYLGKELSGWTDISLGDIVNAVSAFQKFFGLKETGQVDAKTVRAMELYRCGCPDLVQPDTAAGAQYMKMKQFAELNLPRWRKTSIKYCITDYVSGLGKIDQDAIIQEAFNRWMRVAGLNIEKARSGEACDILIGTGQGQKSNFDGPGGVLAWAYLPDGNDQQLLMRFDMDETWITDANQRGILMMNVACHEFGHLLGLDHSKVNSALMAPYYNVNIGGPQDNDDVPRIQARYGPPNAAPPVPPTAPPSPPTAPPTPGNKSFLLIEGAAAIFLDGKKIA